MTLSILLGVAVAVLSAGSFTEIKRCPLRSPAQVWRGHFRKSDQQSWHRAVVGVLDFLLPKGPNVIVQPSPTNRPDWHLRTALAS